MSEQKYYRVDMEVRLVKCVTVQADGPNDAVMEARDILQRVEDCFGEDITVTNVIEVKP